MSASLTDDSHLASYNSTTTAAAEPVTRVDLGEFSRDLFHGIRRLHAQSRPDRGDRGRRPAGRVSVQPGIQPAGALRHRAISRPLLCRARPEALGSAAFDVRPVGDERRAASAQSPHREGAVRAAGDRHVRRNDRATDRRDAGRLAAGRRARHRRGNAAVHAARHQHAAVRAGRSGTGLSAGRHDRPLGVAESGSGRRSAGAQRAVLRSLRGAARLRRGIGSGNPAA